MLLPMGCKTYDERMTNTSDEKKQHADRVTKLANELAAEYGTWNGWTTGIGRYVALGEYILEETESDQPHDEWLMVAREAFLKWKKVHGITMTPPPNHKA
jgi:hypothetical protein